jgi:hypothetical protein
MLRRDAMVRAALVSYYTGLILKNKKEFVDPVAYANIPWVVAHLALERSYSENDSPETTVEILKNVVCFNRGLLQYLILKFNIYTF